jgi:hypothetical protein
MATTKKRTRSAPTEPTAKARQTKRSKAETVLVEDAPRAEPSLTEAAVPPSALAPELPPTGALLSDEMAATALAPMPAEMEATTQAQTPGEQTPGANKLSALDAAVKVLGETGQAMNCQELITVMAARGYWSSPKGRTPAGTLYAAVLRELKTKGAKARFCKTDRGKFALRNAW